MPGLAYASKVLELHPVPNGDFIESAVVCGPNGGKWAGVVQKNQFVVGSPCTVILQDALCPENDPRWSFLKASGWRVKMARFRGAPSECVIIPHEGEAALGTDMTEALGIVKYVKPIPEGMGGVAVGAFPSYIPKTDEPNYQGVPHLVDALRGKPYIITAKADGTSGTAFRHEGHFGVCAREWELQEGPNAYWKAAQPFKDELPEGYAVQYEVIGPGIQKNRLGVPNIIGTAFNVWDIKAHEYLPHIAAVEFCDRIGAMVVQEVERGECFNYTDDQLRTLAEGTYLNGKQREGIVIRCLNAGRHINERISFKVINLLYKD